MPSLSSYASVASVHRRLQGLVPPTEPQADRELTNHPKEKVTKPAGVQPQILDHFSLHLQPAVKPRAAFQQYTLRVTLS